MRIPRLKSNPFKGLIDKEDVAKGIIGGAAATVATHPFEQAQIGTENLRKTVDVRDSQGKLLYRKKNPARYGTVKLPGGREWEFDKGNSGEHLLARLPKGIAGWGASTIIGGMAVRAVTRGKKDPKQVGKFLASTGGKYFK